MGQSDRRKRSSTKGRVLVACVLLATPCLFVSATTQAASRQAQERAARKACLSGDYAKGVSILSDLFVDAKDPTYIFNQGRCFEQNRRYEDAIGRFQEYLRAGTHLDASDKASAEKHIADCQDLLAKQIAQQAAPITAPPVQPTIAQQAPASSVPEATPAPAPVVLQQVQRAPGAPSAGAGLRTAGILTASVGGAALIAGVVLNLKVNSMASDMETTPGGYSSGKESDRKTYQTLGSVGYGVGAACVATGAILYIVGLKSGSNTSPAMAFMPTFGPGQAGAMLKGAF